MHIHAIARILIIDAMIVSNSKTENPHEWQDTTEHHKRHGLKHYEFLML